MKKVLAICSVFFTVCTVLTGCGSSDTPYDSNPTGTVSDRTTSRAEEYVSEAVSGIEDAGDDIINGVTDAVGDIAEGMDGDHGTTSSRD